MKILYVINSMAGGGAEKLLHDLLLLLKNQEECELLALSDKNDKYIGNLLEHGIPVNIVPKGERTWSREVCYIRKKLKEGHYDIVHANLFPSVYLTLLALVGQRRKPILVMTEHSTYNRIRHHRVLRPLEKWRYSNYDYVVSITEKTKENLLQWIKIAHVQPKKFPVIFNGICITDYAESMPYGREELLDNIVQGDIMLLMVGSFTPQKNHALMLRVMEKLPKNYHLLLAGEGPLMDAICNEVSVRQLTDRVHFLGFRKDVARIMRTVDIVVIPSKWEGFGLVAAEGMACGKPVVASRVPGLTEVVGEYGLLADPDKDESFVQVILQLEDLHTYEIYAGKSLIRARDFDISETAAAYLRLYRQAIKSDGKD